MVSDSSYIFIKMYLLTMSQFHFGEGINIYSPNTLKMSNNSFEPNAVLSSDLLN